MQVRNVSNGKRRPRVTIEFSGRPGRSDVECPWPGTVFLAVEAEPCQLGFHMPIKDAKNLLDELQAAIAQATGQ